MDRFELRRLDYSLADDHADLQASYRQFFKTHCGIETVWAAEGSGFDKSLWERLCATGATTMALSEHVGGDGATLVDLTLVAEEVGRAIAPIPWIDHVCATRLLARFDAPNLGPLVSGEQLACLDPAKAGGPRRLLPSGAVAEHVVVLDGDAVVWLRYDARPAKVDNIGRLPMAWVDGAAADHRLVLGTGADAVASYQRAVDEWHVLMAAAMVGLVDAALQLAVEFAKTRYTLGVPIATLQGISHPLANVAVTVAGGRNLARRAAWYLDNEPAERPELPASAYVFMAHETPRAATMASQVQGGLGVSAEAASAAYLLRARGWALAGGDPAVAARHVADVVCAREGNC